MSKVAFLGGGSFGIALAILLANKGNVISVYDRNSNVVEDINVNRRNEKEHFGFSGICSYGRFVTNILQQVTATG